MNRRQQRWNTLKNEQHSKKRWSFRERFGQTRTSPCWVRTISKSFRPWMAYRQKSTFEVHKFLAAETSSLQWYNLFRSNVSSSENCLKIKKKKKLPRNSHVSTFANFGAIFEMPRKFFTIFWSTHNTSEFAAER